MVLLSTNPGTRGSWMSDEKGEMDVPLQINGGRASLQQEVDFNYCYSCSQKIRQAEKVGPAVNRWDWHHIIDVISWFCRWLNIPKLASRNGLCELDEKYKLKLCTMTVQSCIQSPGGDSEVSSSLRLRTQEETSYSDDRQKGRYDDADWFKDNPNRAGGTVVVRTEATVAKYCSYIKGILANDWTVSNRPAVKASVFRYPDRLVRNICDKDTTWIRLTCVWFHNCQVGWIVMSSSKMIPEATRLRTAETVPSQPPETFLKHVSESHFDKLYDLTENIQDVMGSQALPPSTAVCKVMTILNSKCVRNSDT